jgi:signal transduction histidine kinase
MLAPRVVNLNECVASMGELLRRTLGESITIRMQLAADLWLVRVDPTWFESAVLNLAVNGRDAMPDGGTLTIETTNQQFDETVSWQGTDIAPGRYVALLVSDTGTGMTPEILARAAESGLPRAHGRRWGERIEGDRASRGDRRAADGRHHAGQAEWPRPRARSN